MMSAAGQPQAESKGGDELVGLLMVLTAFACEYPRRGRSSSERQVVP
jgi:hypothetical protein